ncbi:formylglycine-generating enzyme family protein, partial [Candidatus Poribacteria bacterium]|nr:formylglycine-generating enzyme family protein [Candidatus Poribacteria bacterium]
MNNQAHNYVSGFSRSTMNHQYWPHKIWPHTTWLFCTLFTFLLVSCGGQQQSNSNGNSNGGALTQLPKLIRKDEVSGQWVVASRKNAEMVLVPAGTFLMGTSKNMSDRIASGYSMNFWDEMPQHKVTVRDFYIDRHEVTNEAYNKYLKEQGGASPRFWRDPKFNHPRQPIVGISWDDATDYARWLGKRLPTEAEWEKAACWDWERAEELNIP